MRYIEVNGETFPDDAFDVWDEDEDEEEWEDSESEDE